MLPLISANNGSIIFFCFWVFVWPASQTYCVPPTEILMLWLVSRFMLRNQKREDGGQQHKNQRLHDSHEYLHKIKRNRDEPGQRGYHRRHCFQHVLARVNISEKSKAERDRTEQNRHNLEPAHHEKDHDHEQLQNTGGLAF